MANALSLSVPLRDPDKLHHQAESSTKQSVQSFLGLFPIRNLSANIGSKIIPSHPRQVFCRGTAPLRLLKKRCSFIFPKPIASDVYSSGRSQVAGEEDPSIPG